MEGLLNFLAGGLSQASGWQIALYTLIVTHITILSVTLYLHRCQTHRGLDLHPIVSHFFRFWLWLTTGMITKEWVSIHRKHHARCEREGDPHSPLVFGINKVFFEGAELYRQEALNLETMAKFGHGTPDDWIERKLYARHAILGVSVMLLIDIALFGALGLTVWAIQMAWIPLWAAGVVNGVGHYWGYRNFDSPDASRNVFPIGLIIGGEELHNNHHAYASSARFSSKWYELDIGWLWIKALSWCRLATIRRVAPPIKFNDQSAIDLDTLQAVITHRYEVMARYTDVVKKTCQDELERLKLNVGGSQALRHIHRWLHRVDDESLPADQREVAKGVLAAHGSLALLVEMRQELVQIWERSHASSEQLLRDLQDWCNRAQQSGLVRLEEFSLRLRRYAA